MMPLYTTTPCTQPSPTHNHLLHKAPYLDKCPTVALAEVKAPPVKLDVLPQPLQPVDHVLAHQGVGVVDVGGGGKQGLRLARALSPKLAAVAVVAGFVLLTSAYRLIK